MDLDSFRLKQLELLEKEHEAEIDANRKYQEQLSLAELQQLGVCLLKLRVASTRTGLYGRHMVAFRQNNDQQLPSNCISSGDIVGIAHSKERIILISGVVLRVDKFSIEVAFDYVSEDQLFTCDNQLFNILKLANDVTHRRLKLAINDLKNCESHPLVGVLFGQIPFRDSLSCNESVKFFNSKLNEPQREAVEFALLRSDIAIIHGPPGTGKTTTLIEFILQCVKVKNLKVLVCAPSNVAVDNVLEKLVQEKVNGIIRLGHPARAFEKLQDYSLDAVLANSDQFQVIRDLRSEIDGIWKEKRRDFNNLKSLRKELKAREAKSLRDVILGSRVVLSTLTSASPDGPLKAVLKYDKKILFDVVVIDECSQALEAACWIVLPMANKCVLAGDHLQLPPTIISEEAAKQGLEITLMKRLLDMEQKDTIMRMLTIQYRMNELIMNWSSQQFYNKKLIAHESVASHSLDDLVANTDLPPLLMIDTAGCDMNELDLEDEESKGNDYEADLVTVYVNKLMRLKLSQTSIGIISPYNLQVELLKKRISKKFDKIEIKSVDGFQGREKEVIILSLVRSNLQKQVGFLSEKRRINVAVTRAKRHLVVVGDSETVCSDPLIESLVDYLTEFGEVVSAQEFLDEINNLESVERPAHLRYKSNKKEEKGVSKNYNSKKLVKKEKLKDLKSSENNLKIENMIKQFLLSSDTILEFPKTFSSLERRIVHEYAEKYKLIHESKNEGPERYILVKKVM